MSIPINCTVDLPLFEWCYTCIAIMGGSSLRRTMKLEGHVIVYKQWVPPQIHYPRWAFRRPWLPLMLQIYNINFGHQYSLFNYLQIWFQLINSWTSQPAPRRWFNLLTLKYDTHYIDLSLSMLTRINKSKKDHSELVHKQHKQLIVWLQDVGGINMSSIFELLYIIYFTCIIATSKISIHV